jgi:hypothetical protein
MPKVAVSGNGVRWGGRVEGIGGTTKRAVATTVWTGRRPGEMGMAWKRMALVPGRGRGKVVGRRTNEGVRCCSPLDLEPATGFLGLDAVRRAAFPFLHVQTGGLLLCFASAGRRWFSVNSRLDSDFVVGGGTEYRR